MTDDRHAYTEDGQPKLTRRRKRFVELYDTGLTGAEAIRRTGYQGTPAQAARIAYHWLRDPAVINFRRERAKNLEESTQIRQEQILRRLNLIAIGTMQQLEDENGNSIPLHKMPDEIAATIQEIEYEYFDVKLEDGTIETRRRIKKIKQYAPKTAAEQIARQMGWNKDSLELKAKIDAPPPVINLVVFDDESDAVSDQPKAS